MLSRPSFRSAFVFSINSLILSGFPLISFHLAEASLSAFSWFYTLVCAVVQKSFVYDYSHFWYSLCNQPVLFAQLEQQPHRACEQTKPKQKRNRARHIQIDLAVYNCSILPTNNAMVSLKDGFTV